MGREVRATQQQLDSLEGAVSTTGKELSHLAETMGGCLTAVHQEVASSSGSSYLSALLAPVTPSGGAAAAAAGGAFGPGRPQASQWVGLGRDCVPVFCCCWGFRANVVRQGGHLG
jgi:hypothetical protein